jgi:hypothetical protein
VVKELVVDEVLEDIFEYFKEQTRPPEEEEPRMDFALNLEDEPLCYWEPKEDLGA